MGRRGRNRRALIGKRTDTRQVPIRRTSHRGTSQDKGKGEDEAGGPHLTVSGCPWPGCARRLVDPVIASGCFRTSAPKLQNGFVAMQNCFVAPSGRNNGRKISMNSAATPLLERIRLNAASRRSEPCWPSSNGRERSCFRMNRRLGPADSVEHRATFRVLVRSDPFLNKG